ncbi:polysaccharide deacetylase family protein [Candidatus Gottesmanbacteria bacterium]|nr:polysaccharide deacetylase family protein [Candidatus Gottesmanbacteria bacterium]
MSLPTPTPTPTPSLLRLPPSTPGENAYKVPVLLYHYIEVAPPQDPARGALATPPDVLDTQFALLAAGGFTPITFDELAAAMNGKITLPAKPVILTFDDGYADFYANAYPILQKYHMKAVSFIPTGLIGGGNYMTWGQVEELARSPYVVFGAHSIHHPDLTRLSLAALRSEIVESKHTLESHVGYIVNWFAYPYGLFDENVVSDVRGAGYIGSVTTIPGSFQYQSRLFYIPRYRAGKRTGEDFLRLVR